MFISSYFASTVDHPRVDKQSDESNTTLLPRVAAATKPGKMWGSATMSTRLVPVNLRADLACSGALRMSETDGQRQTNRAGAARTRRPSSVSWPRGVRSQGLRRATVGKPAMEARRFGRASLTALFV